jgi:hypothetical protein
MQCADYERTTRFHFKNDSIRTFKNDSISLSFWRSLRISHGFRLAEVAEPRNSRGSFLIAQRSRPSGAPDRHRGWINLAQRVSPGPTSMLGRPQPDWGSAVLV